jgi:hypothetical protein
MMATFKTYRTNTSLHQNVTKVNKIKIISCNILTTL